MAVTATSRNDSASGPASAHRESAALQAGTREVPLARWAVRLSLAVLCLAMLDPAGWVFHIRLLTSVLPGYATMKPNTAIGLGLIAAACLLRSRAAGDGCTWKRVTADATSLAAFLLAGATLVEMLSGRNFGIDTFLLKVGQDAFGDPAGRMSPGTAFCLTVSGLALLLLDRFPRLSAALAVVVSGTSVAGIIGFFFDQGPLFGVPALRSLAIHTALGLLALQAATFALRPEREPVRSLIRQQQFLGGDRRWILPGVTIVPTLVAIPLVMGLRMGWFDPPFALALLVVLLTAIQTLILWKDSSQLLRLEERKRQAEQALLQSEKLAVVGRLAASISHEINNPLEAVGNLLYLIRTEPSHEQARKYALTAEEELGRVSQIATQTLSFYRENRSAVTCSASGVVEAALRLLQAKIAASDVRLEKEFASQDDKVDCRDGELRQVFINLISNALEATPPGGRLRVRTHGSRSRRGIDVRGIRIVIGDTGCGMTPEVQRRIFEPFFTTKTDVGNGLGLWVARELIEKQGGSIEVRSSTAAGRSGTVFCVFLPCAARDEDVAAV